MMQLKRQHLTGLYRQSFDLKLLSDHQGLIRPPGTPHCLVLRGLRTVNQQKCLHHLFHILHAIFGAHHDRIGCLDNHQIGDSHTRDQATVTANIIIAGVVQEHIALGDIALLITRTHLPQCGPCADITPTATQCGHTASLGMFHHRVINAVGRRRQKGFRVGANKI